MGGYGNKMSSAQSEEINVLSDQSVSPDEDSRGRLISDYISVIDRQIQELSFKDEYIAGLERDRNRLQLITGSHTYKLSRLLAKIIDRIGLRKLAILLQSIANKNRNIPQKHIEDIPDELREVAEELCNHAELIEPNAVNALTVRFFEHDGSHFYGGGAERYLIDLRETCKELGVGFKLYQYATYPWVRFVDDLEVEGLCSSKNDIRNTDESLIKEMGDVFDEAVGDDAAVSIYSAFNLLQKPKSRVTIGISHGVFWDEPGDHFGDGELFAENHRSLIESARLCREMVSVDTNTCNWFQTISYELGKKLHYIPNYVDTAEFFPRSGYLEKREKTIITYPRRLCEYRGLYAVLDIIDEILMQYPDVEFHFVGRGYDEDTRHVKEKVEKWPGRVLWYYRMPDEMPEVYRQSDISLIPTMYSEGTSLSCLEALASGNAVIATRIGGLTDMIINDYNGLLVEPNAASIYLAIKELLDDPARLALMKESAVSSAGAFSKKRWKGKWKEILQRYLKESDCSRNSDTVRRCIIELENDENLKEPAVSSYLRKMLDEGWYLFVTVKDSRLKYLSRARLQFIEPDDELYFVPEKTVKVSEILT